MTLMVSLGYALSRLIVLTRLLFLKTCGGVKVLGSTCLESSGLDWLSSADAKLETAAMQPARNEIDLMMGSSQVTQSHVRFWMEIKVAWWCCWNVAHTRLLHSCSLRRSRWGTSVLGIAMQLKLHPTGPLVAIHTPPWCFYPKVPADHSYTVCALAWSAALRGVT